MSLHQFCSTECAQAATELADNGEVFKAGENGYITRNDGMRLHLRASDAQYINMKFKLQDDINELRDVLYFQETGSSRGPDSEGASGESAGTGGFGGTDDESDR